MICSKLNLLIFFRMSCDLIGHYDNIYKYWSKCIFPHKPVSSESLTTNLLYMYSSAPIRLLTVTTYSLGRPILFEPVSNITGHGVLQNVCCLFLFIWTANLNKKHFITCKLKIETITVALFQHTCCLGKTRQNPYFFSCTYFKPLNM